MIQKKINNTIAFVIVMCFLILSFSAMAETTTVDQTTSPTETKYIATGWFSYIE